MSLCGWIIYKFKYIWCNYLFSLANNSELLQLDEYPYNINILFFPNLIFLNAILIVGTQSNQISNWTAMHVTETDLKIYINFDVDFFFINELLLIIRIVK